jgi:hypothetical protein
LAQPPTSVTVPGLPCTVGQRGLLFTLVNGSYVINYSGYSVCTGQPAAAHDLTICTQVAKDINGRIVWFTVTGSCLFLAAASRSARLGTAKTAFLGVAYRVMGGPRSATPPLTAP